MTMRILTGTEKERGSALIVALLALLTMAILGLGFSIMTNTETKISGMQETETKAFYIAQSGMERAVKQLFEAPGWRDGFSAVPLDGGTYDITVYDPIDDGYGQYDSSLAANYIRIVSSADLNGVRKEVEGLWANPYAAFNYSYSAGNEVAFHNHGTPSAVIVADIHNNSWNGGPIALDEGTTVYGNITGVGDILIGKAKDGNPTLVYGNVWGKTVTINDPSEVRKYQNLDESVIGRDLTGDNDLLDFGLTKGLAEVTGSTSILSGGINMMDGTTEAHIAAATVPVTVGGLEPGQIVDPRPDFALYYELATGGMGYPPGGAHVITPISGDGDGHYFASTADLTAWLDANIVPDARCWRCAGDGAIDPFNTTVCPTCAGTGLVTAAEVTGVLYVDDTKVDLSTYPNNIIIHGSIVVAQGDPNAWPAKTINIPGGTTTIDHFPTTGVFLLKGASRNHFTQTYRSDVEGGTYVWNTRQVYAGADQQSLPIREPEAGHFMRNFPSILAASKIDIHPREAGDSYYQADIGDEMVTILQGVEFAESEIHMHGKGGSKGAKPFDETRLYGSGDKIKEGNVGIDLNGDGDTKDKVKVGSITTVPVIPVGAGQFQVDINADGVFEVVVMGADYNSFFMANGYEFPVLLYHEGILLGQKLHTCEHYQVTFDPLIAAGGIPFGFSVDFGGKKGYQGLIAWRENTTDQ